MNPTKTPRGLERGRGKGGRNADDRDRKVPPSTVSEASSKRAKVAESDDNKLYTSDEDSTTSTNRNNKALTRSSPSGRQKKSDE
jgi:hypothetical protein